MAQICAVNMQVSSAAALANYTTAPPHAHPTPRPADSPTVTISPLGGHSSFLSISFHDDEFMFWLLGISSNQENTKTPKYGGEGDRLERERPDSHKEAGISQQAAGQLLSLTNDAHMRLICIS